MCIITVAACSSTKKLASGKATTPSDPSLVQGKSIYEGHCGQCHALKNPSQFTEAQFTTIVPKMVQKVNKKEGTTSISPEDESKLLKYLVSVCKKS